MVNHRTDGTFPMDYLPRIVDDAFEEKLAYAKAVCIRGPKWCGKTSTALQKAKSVLYMQEPDARRNNLRLAREKPSILLRGERPRLIDEWQDAPILWDAVRHTVDHEPGAGLFILTGSATPGERPAHTGTGRFSFLDMRFMTLYESGDSTGDVSIRELFDGGKDPDGYGPIDIEDVAYLTCHGGWPQIAHDKSEYALNIAYDYVNAIMEEDVSRVDGVQRSADYARLLLAEYARCTSTMASLNSMRGNIARHGREVSRPTADAYLAALRRLYVIDDLEPWFPSLRTKSRIASTPGRFLTDPSIAAAALEADPQMLLMDLATLGTLFESLCIRDLKVYAEALKGHLYRYHDHTGLEADAVLVLRGGRYALMEVKLGASEVDEGAASLLTLSSRINAGITGEPAFCAVITPGGYAYRRSDGVLVLPISCLRP